jgi:hypothetical protein
VAVRALYDTLLAGRLYGHYTTPEGAVGREPAADLRGASTMRVRAASSAARGV